MQIICSKCNKVYTVDAGKIPSNVSATRCKACGNSIPLRPAAQKPASQGESPAPPATRPDVMRITCQYCSQQFKIKSSAIPDGATRIRCKSCGHRISLKPQADAAPTTPTAAKSAEKTSGVLKIACLYCGKKYNINPAKIPPGVTTTRCKACSRPMSIKPTPPAVPAKNTGSDANVVPMQPQKVGKTGTDGEEGPIIADVGKPVSPIWQRWQTLAAAAGIILVVLAGYFAATHWFKSGDGRPSASSSLTKAPALKKNKTPSGKGVAAAKKTEVEPFLAVRLNVPLLLAAVDQNMAEEKKDIGYKMTTAIINSFGLTNFDLYLYPHAEHGFLPVIFGMGKEGSSLEKIIKAQANFVQLLEPLADGSYRFKKEAIPADKQNPFPIEQYRVQFIEEAAVIAPEHLNEILQGGPGPLFKTQVAKMITAIAQPDDVAVLSVRIPENFNSDWQKTIQRNPAVQQNPQASMMIAMGGGIMAQLSEPLKDVDSLAVGFRLDKSNKRMLSYAQQFRKGVDGNSVYQQLKSGNPNNLDVDGVVLKLVQLFNDPRYEHEIGYKNNRLTLGLNWEKTHDEALLTALSEATIGQLFAQGMDLTPTEGPVAAQYIDAPRILPAVNTDSLKKTLPAAVEQNLFPGNYWGHGEEPRMTLDFDTLAIPNAALAQLKYEVVDVLATDGADIRRVEGNAFQHVINPGSVSPGFIEITVKKDTPAEKLGVAKIKFNIALPSRLKMFEFISGKDASGAAQGTDGVSVKLRRLEKDVAKVSYRGGLSAKLFAFDKTGQALASRESMSAASSAATRFQGEIYRLQVVVVEELFAHPFEVAADLNHGKELALSHKPEDPPRRRYDHRPMQTYANYTAEELDGLDVEWREAGGMMWTDSLRVNLPRGPFSGDIRWEAHFFGESEPIIFSGSSFNSPSGFSYGLSNGELKSANAAFGKVQMELASSIQRLTFDKQADGKTGVQRLPSGRAIKIAFNQNEITLDAGTADVIQSMAFDTQGLQLRKDGYTGIKGNRKKMYFWGLPSRFVIDVATETIHKTVNFDVRRRTVDENRYKKYKQDISNQRDIVRTLKQIAAARRKDKTKYGDDIAGLFYLYDRKKKKPMALVDQKVAHSDPAGQERFGYTLKPYKGYYFTLLSGVDSGGTRNDYMRLPKQRSYSWKKGAIKTAPFLQPPDLVAIPTDPSQPTFFMQFDQVFMKQLNGHKLTYLPEDYYSTGWVEAKFVEG